MKRYTEIVENFEELYDKLTEEIEDAYLIRVKCIACSGGEFLKFETPLLREDFLVIGDTKYPFKLIEDVVVRVHDKWLGKYEYKYKIKSSVLKELLKSEIQEELGKYKLI